MRKAFLFIFFTAITHSCIAQTYICLAPSVTNSPGTFAEKSNMAFELGRQWDVFSMGMDIGATTLGKIIGKDTAIYLEARPNLNIFQVGKFTNTFTPGIGYIFNAKENLMTEVTYGIEYSWTPLVHINMYFGQYYYSGRESASNVSFFGLSVMKYFAPSKAKALITGKISK